ncbi:MAG: putative rane protein [Frankiales bacterium]|nr:putative rane protein [Frankiales bacterium]
MTPDSSSLRAVLSLLGFRRLLRVRMAGQLADGLFQAALFSAVFFNPERATSAAEAASAFAVLLLPYSVVGPFAGVLLDRWSRQRILLHANLLRAGLVLVLGGLIALLGPTALLVQSVALVIISINRFVLSGLSAAQPHVVAEPDLVVANSFSSTLGGAATLVGGGLAVALRQVLGEDDTGAARGVVVAAAVYVGAAFLAGRLARGALGPDHPPTEPWQHAVRLVARGVRQGAQHVRERGPAARGLAAITSHRFFFGLSFVMALLLYTDDGAIGTGVSGLGQVVVGSGIGGLAAALLTPRATRRLGEQTWITVVFALAAAVQLAFGLPFVHAAFVAAAAILGFAAQAAKITLDTLLQESVEDDFRGRVFSFYDTLFNLSFVSAAAAAAPLLPDDGRSRAVVVLIAAGYALTALAYGLACRWATDRPGVPVEPVARRE